MKITRRHAMMTGLFGASYVGLRSLATGLSPAMLLNPREALAAGTCTNQTNAQFIILQTSGSGDPINANVPGTYEDPGIYHSTDPTMVATDVQVGGTDYKAAAPWATLQPYFGRTAFFHCMTNTPVHPKEPSVLAFNGAITPADMFPSLIAAQLAPCLGTVQTQPISLGATSPSEGLTFGGAPLPIIPPLALKATLASTPGALTNLQALRDQTLNQFHDMYYKTATAAQKTYLDELITSQAQVRNISQSLLGNLDSIKDNTADSQLLAAITLIQMKVTPVIAVHIPFGGDNHFDAALKTESTQTVSGVASILGLLKGLQGQPPVMPGSGVSTLADNVTFLSLNVFGRTLNSKSTDGRQHNQNHQVSIAIGRPFKGGVIGGVAAIKGDATANDYGATGIDSSTGASDPNGDIVPVDTLASFGKTVLSGVGVDSATIDKAINTGKVIPAALA